MVKRQQYLLCLPSCAQDTSTQLWSYIGTLECVIVKEGPTCNLWVDKENDCRIAPGWDHALPWPRQLPSVVKLDKQCPTAVHKVKPGQVDEDEADKLQRLQLHALRILEYLEQRSYASPCIDGDERGLALADLAQGRVRGRDVVEASVEEEAAREVEQRVVVAAAPRHRGQEVQRQGRRHGLQLRRLRSAARPAAADDAGRALLALWPLPLIFRLLAGDVDAPPGVEDAAVAVLERLFSTPHGASLLPPSLPFAEAGLRSPSPAVRQLSCSAVRLLQHSSVPDPPYVASFSTACKGHALRACQSAALWMNPLQVSRLLTGSESDRGEAVHAFASARLREPVLRTLADESPSVAAAALQVVQQLARSPEGLAELFPMESEVNTLTKMAMTGPVTVRLRALEAAALLAGVSEEAAAAVRDAGISAASVWDLEDSDDILARVATLELLGQLASTTTGARIVAAADLNQRLAVILRDKDEDELIRIHALLVAARLLSLPLDAPSGPSTSDAQAVVQAMEACILQSQVENDIEQVSLTLEQATFDAIEQIAKAAQSAELLLVPPGRLVRQVTIAAFKSNLDTHRLAAVNALSSIAGYYREDGAKLLKADAEAVLQDAIYSAATAAPGPLTLGGGLESLVRQPSSESSHAGYRLLTALVYRMWAVVDICSSRTLLDTLIKPQVEVSIKDFQLRQSACQAVASAAAAALESGSVQLPQHVVDELHEAARTKVRTSESGTARPVVATMER
eukprot:SM000157S02074  [mRNA]  locus=s157:93364:98947:+ [translate_table: standard]